MKQSAVQRILSDSANHVTSQRGAETYSSFEGKIVPEIKTIPEYVSALDRAVELFFRDGNDKDILAILKDAKMNNLVPKRYKSPDVIKINRNGVIIKKANMIYSRDGIIIRLYIGFGRVGITPKYSKIDEQVLITTELGNYVYSIQRTLKKMQKLIV